MRTWVLGFDLSLSAPAAVALPRDWDGNWLRVKTWTTSPPKPANDTDLRGQLERYDYIACWASRLVAEIIRPTDKEPLGFVEQYGFSRNTNSGSRIMESGGIVKMRVWERANMLLHPVAQNSARKTFFGKIPRGGNIKVFVQDALFNRLGAPKTWTEDVADAFVIANHGLSLLGGQFITLNGSYVGPKVEAPAKARKTPARPRKRKS